MTKLDVLIAELKGEENKLRTKSSEVSRKAKKYDYIVQVWQGGEWFSIYCDSDYNKAKAISIYKASTIILNYYYYA